MTCVVDSSRRHRGIAGATFGLDAVHVQEDAGRDTGVTATDQLLIGIVEAQQSRLAQRFDVGHALLAEVTDPFADRPGREAFTLPAPMGFGDYVTFCGT